MAEQTLKRFLHEMTTKMRDTSSEPKSDTISGMMQLLATQEKDEIPDKYKKHTIK